jgi:Immunoglobulin-like domain of bacterial spore germination
MTPDERLRSAITARTSGIEPASDGLHRIQETLMNTQRDTNRNRLLLALGSAAAAVAVIVGVLALTDDDDRTIDTVDTTTTAPELTTSTSEPSTTTVVTPSTVDPGPAVFPDPTTSRRFDDPAAVAQAFATDLLGFSDPLVGDFMQGDSRSGEIEVRAFAQGNPTLVLVRQLEDDTWFVIGAVVESIRLDTPEQGATISSPQALEGAAFAFEGTVNVRLFVDGVAEPIAETFVTGRGDGELGDFTGELTFDLPAGAEHGVLVLSEASAKDGSTIAATVIRVHF